jgi:tRNA G26 N,N-dimethylase Trm1
MAEAMGTDHAGPGGPRLERLCAVWVEEAGLPPLMVDANRLAGRLKVPTPRMDRVIARLTEMGYSAGRAHTNPVGLKSDAPVEVLEDLFRQLAERV